MGKVVVLKFGEGRFDEGFSVTLQIGEEGDRPSVEVTGRLPAAPDLLQTYQRWRQTYRRLGLPSRLEAPAAQVTNVALSGDCQEAAQHLRDRFSLWLQAESFRPIREKWLEQLSPTDEIRVILQGADPGLQYLPWHLWDLLERYSKAEIALSSAAYERVSQPRPPRGSVRILAILGNSEGIDVQADRRLLEQLPDAEICFLVEPQRQDLTDRLWEQRWDILFFAGHSLTQESGEAGQIHINPTESLTISQLRYALKKAMERGLKLAIFNSCDGLGLARELADLHIPQLVVMREPVPDRVAQAFLQYFLAAFSKGRSLYLAVREARERLQALEEQFPCATWLPVIFQNPAEVPFTWYELTGRQYFDTTIRDWLQSPQSPHKTHLRQSLKRSLISSLTVAAAVTGLRYFGLLQGLELGAFDRMLTLRPDEGTDPRILLITIDDSDIQAQQERTGSLSESSLEAVLEKLEPHNPRVIGLDVYRDFAAERATLTSRLQQAESLIAVCKAGDPDGNAQGIAPPPEIPASQIGFSDFIEDDDGTVRRHLLFMSADPASRCTTPYAFSSQIAFRYLAAEGIVPTFTSQEDLRFGDTVFHSLRSRTGGYQAIDARGSQVLLNYRSTDRIAAQVSLTQVLRNEVDLSVVRDKIVLIGVTAYSAGDYWVTPYGAGPTEKVSGIEVQAHMISQIVSAVLDDRPLLWVWNPWVEVLWIGTWAIIGGLLAWRMRSSTYLGLAIAILSCLLGVTSVVVLIRGGWLPLVPAVLAMTGSSIVVLLARPVSDLSASPLTPAPTTKSF
ncbi:CHASE2 domain-containing protein [Oscillatoria sp. FACHB-1407]|uniref:CHASE2 domain-containing protein n=1 Tax=Oscillatoria sp. FACHB-1407 TaxID=2692847 RepID=UPI00168279B4|nr:CHASE2 domain-containing protein [Oscillatoria sp. FACHB-1407]MBD2464603.1 CHASE2 domain-containing protein [Oscillatoria sp. FACHB-1407]